FVAAAIISGVLMVSQTFWCGRKRRDGAERAGQKETEKNRRGVHPPMNLSPTSKIQSMDE
ncbi:unnamed protein product, partial [Tetraodon nigroviridis]